MLINFILLKRVSLHKRRVCSFDSFADKLPLIVTLIKQITTKRLQITI